MYNIGSTKEEELFETTILIIGGFSNKKGHERFRRLYERMIDEVSDDEIILIPDYLGRWYWPRYLTGLIFGRKTLKEYSEWLIGWCRKYTPSSSPIHIVVGYSMGGPIARYVAKRMPAVKKLILVASPNRGIKKLSRWKRLFLFRIKCIKDTLPGSEFLKMLDNELPLQCKVYLIGGSKDNVVSSGSALGIPDVPARQKIIFPLGHSELIPGPASEKKGAIDQIIQLCKNPSRKPLR